ncbi:TlpA disulfide reductase family protein [Sphingobacterium sp. BIGb0165]|uniref:TlpA disulfide reductase family protein n=1 Tax=Sphingobacterium sp. BIGb0165 TaxID=2940615 RepID=UPI002169CB50|nr:TlpA disulfide reductase family protein [Sphingobacterium sp. BIGb0165]MCS4226932.1 peroxiredoxin [Sphingobacterium sp. BIGb0165]
MRLAFLALALLLSGQLSYGQQNYFTIEGKLTKKTDYKYIYLNYESTAGFKQDSSLIKNGAFYFKGIPVYGTHAYIQLKDAGTADPDDGNQFDFSIEPVNFKIHINGNLNKSRIEGSPIDKDLQKLNRILEPAYLAREKWYERYDQFKATASQDSIELNKYSIEYKKLEQDETDLAVDYIINHPGSFPSLMTLERFSRRLKLIQIEELFDGLDDRIKQTFDGKEFRKRIDRMNAVQIGRIAPDFSARDTAGNMVSLDSLKGKYLLLDFWASWCGPCREENPYVVKAYEKFKAKNFEILGISLDDETTKEKWLKAIKEDQLTWLQVSDLKGWQSEVAELYHVRGIPQNFLLDPNGVIIATNLREEELLKTLEDILGK